MRSARRQKEMEVFHFGKSDAMLAEIIPVSAPSRNQAFPSSIAMVAN